MDDNCLRTDGLSPEYRALSSSALLPEFGCLVLSPANLWRRDPSAFQSDPDVVGTVFQYHAHAHGHSSLAELLLGMRQRDTGLTRYPVRNRQRVVSYAATVALHGAPDPRLPAALRARLREAYPVPTAVAANSSGQDGEDFSAMEVVHVFFPSRWGIPVVHSELLIQYYLHNRVFS